jgi:hypothetical protein
MSPEDHKFSITHATEILPKEVPVGDGQTELRYLNRDEARKLKVVVDSGLVLEDGEMLPVEETEGSDVTVVRVEPGHVTVEGIQEAVAAHKKELEHAA